MKKRPVERAIILCAGFAEMTLEEVNALLRDANLSDVSKSSYPVVMRAYVPKLRNLPQSLKEHIYHPTPIGKLGKVPKLKISHDRDENSLTVWFDEPKKMHISEEIGNEVVLLMDKKKKVIGFKKLNFLS